MGKSEKLDKSVEREDIIELKELVQAEAILKQIENRAIKDYSFSFRSPKEQLEFADDKLKAAKALLIDAKRHDARAVEFINKLLQSLSAESKVQNDPTVRVVAVSLHEDDELILKNVLGWEASITLLLYELNNLAFIVSQDLEAVREGRERPAYYRDFQIIGSHVQSIIPKVTRLIESVRKAYQMEEYERQFMAKKRL